MTDPKHNFGIFQLLVGFRASQAGLQCGETENIACFTTINPSDLKK